MSLCLSAVLMLSACGGKKTDDPTLSTEPQSSTTVTTELPTAAPTEAPTEAPTVPAPGDNQQLDWENLHFTLDGKECTIFGDFKLLQELGWDFDLADYGKGDTYMLNPGDSVMSTIKLENEKYINPDNLYRSVDVTVGFKNVSDELKDIKDCAISSFEIVAYGKGQLLELRPEFNFLGLTFGSTKDDMVKVLGSEYSEHRSDELGYTVYTYEHEYSEKIRITVYDDIGIAGFDIQSYR